MKVEPAKTPGHFLYDAAEVWRDPTFSIWRQKYESIGRSRSHAVFVLGPMGTGKSTYIKTHLLVRKQDLIYVDTDEIMASIEGFSADEIARFYRRARMVSLALTDWLLDNGYSFIAEGTCVIWEELWNYMKRLKSSGYRISVTVLEESVETAISRASGRERKLPEGEVVRIHRDSVDGCRNLILKNKDDHVFDLVDKEEL